VCPNCTTIGPELGRHIAPVESPQRRRRSIRLAIWTGVAAAVAIAVVVFRELGVAGGIALGVAIALGCLYEGFDEEKEDWLLSQSPVGKNPVTHYSFLRGEYEVVTITEDVPKFAACAACRNPVKLADNVTEHAKAQAAARLHRNN